MFLIVRYRQSEASSSSSSVALGDIRPAAALPGFTMVAAGAHALKHPHSAPTRTPVWLKLLHIFEITLPTLAWTNSCRHDDAWGGEARVRGWEGRGPLNSCVYQVVWCFSQEREGESWA